MLAIAQTIAPIFLLIVIGFGFKRFGFPGEGFWQPAEKLAYYVLLPVLIVRNLATADLGDIQVPQMAGALIATAVTMTALTLALRPVLPVSGPAFTSLLQGAIRLNSYIPFGVAEALYGGDGVVMCALFVSIMIPTVNVISIGALAVYARTGKPDWRRVPWDIAKNPMVLSCAIGAALNALDVPLPKWGLDLMSIVGRSALPLALLCVGAGLVLQTSRAEKGALALTCVLKLAVMPAIAWGAATVAGLGGLTFVVAVMFCAMPASPASYVLARQLGGDAPLMAGILTVQTALAAFTIPALLIWLQ